MRYAFIILFMISFSSCISQHYASTSYPTPFKLEKIDTIPGTKSEIFVRANEWVAKTFVSAKEVIQMHDKDAGKIIAKGIMVSKSSLGVMIGSQAYYVSYTLAIDVKDGRCKISFSDFILTEGYFTSTQGKDRVSHYSFYLDNDGHPKDIYPKAWTNVKGDCWAAAKALRKDFQTYMKEGNKDW